MFFEIIIMNYFMKNNSSEVTEKYNQLLQLMSLESGGKDKLTIAQKTVILAHTFNLQLGLACISRESEVIQFPQYWHLPEQQVYKFNYIFKQKQLKGKIIQFRLVNNLNQLGTISVNYSLEDSQQLFQYELKSQPNKLQESFKLYEKEFNKNLKIQNGQQANLQKPRALEPQWRSPVVENPRQPFPILQPGRNTSSNPFSLPTGGGQYIGPDNQIFKGRSGNIFDPFGSNSRNIDLRRPMGSRFDPIDPFGSQGMDQRPFGNRDFMGFNEFGQPFGGRGGFGPGRF